MTVALKISLSTEKKVIEPAGDVGRYEDGSVFRFEFGQCCESLILRHLSVKRNSHETQVPQHKSSSYSIVASSAENHEAVSCQFVENMHKIDVLLKKLI